MIIPKDVVPMVIIIVEIKRILAISILLNLPISASQGPAHSPNIARPVPPAIPDNGPILQKA